jgi:hypothetical protein
MSPVFFRPFVIAPSPNGPQQRGNNEKPHDRADGGEEPEEIGQMASLIAMRIERGLPAAAGRKP